LIFAFSSLREGAKCAIGALPFAGTLLDIGGMWATRFASPSLSVLVIAGGTLFALGDALIAGVSIYDLWFRKELSVSDPPPRAPPGFGARRRARRDAGARAHHAPPRSRTRPGRGGPPARGLQPLLRAGGPALPRPARQRPAEGRLDAERGPLPLLHRPD